MKILYYDCFAGISGDMNLAAMIGLGVEPDHLRAELSRLGLDHEFELVVSEDARNGIHGVRVDVKLCNAEEGHAHACGHGGGQAHPHADGGSGGHDHGHDHDDPHAEGHGHGHGHHHDDTHAKAHRPGHGHHVEAGRHAAGHDALDGPGHERGHHHGHHAHAPHRNLADIRGIINASSLPDAVKKTSLAIFHKVAEAEATVHGKPVDEVHFHEVGATDSIVDIVGAAICFHRLGVDAVWASPVELGGGFVRCAHGLIPVPAPATAEILKGVPTTRGAARHECATPTGAAILAAEFPRAPALVVEKTAYGIGHRQAELPNVLRVQLATPADARPVGRLQAARLLQCNIDDMTAEMLGVAMELLMEQGAMDVHFTPIMMKKNRPATCVSLLCSASDEERFKELLLRHTTTLGVKSIAVDKTVLDISFERLETPLGPVTMKNAILHGRVIRSKPELEDCRELARRHAIPLAEVYAVIGGCRREPG